MMICLARYDREQLRVELERLARRPIDITLTTNASSFISFVPGSRPLRVRIQRIFLDAPDEVIVAVGRWLGGREKRCPREVRRFIDCPPAGISMIAHTRKRKLMPVGHCYDLRQILDRVSAQYFQGRVDARITWGRHSSRRSVQARTLGAYYRSENIIFVNPVLDQREVPEWFLAFTIYHECLHSVQSVDDRPHDRKFQTALERHPDYRAALRWEKANIRLLTRRVDMRRRMAGHDVRRTLPEDLPGQLDFKW